eukprot:Sspe_Gene.32806::Locus_16061_Transcript_2_3_Confidence_0.500_Length_2405::g.32806::m.32806
MRLLCRVVVDTVTYIRTHVRQERVGGVAMPTSAHRMAGCGPFRVLPVNQPCQWPTIRNAKRDTPPPATTPSFPLLPLEVVRSILTYLAPHNVVSAARSNRRFHWALTLVREDGPHEATLFHHILRLYHLHLSFPKMLDQPVSFLRPGMVSVHSVSLWCMAQLRLHLTPAMLSTLQSVCKLCQFPEVSRFPLRMMCAV